jgi:hypothetical protein
VTDPSLYANQQPQQQLPQQPQTGQQPYQLQGALQPGNWLKTFRFEMDHQICLILFKE